MTNSIHDFEKVGLGKAPFRYIGAEERRSPIKTVVNGVETTVGAPGQAMGSCDFCGQGIAICCRIDSADGKRFTVGIDCVRRTGDAGLKAASDKKIRAIKKKARLENQAKRIAAAKEAIKGPVLQVALERQPHPMADIWKRKKTLLDYAKWMFANAGNTGQMRAVKAIEKTAQEIKTDGGK